MKKSTTLALGACLSLASLGTHAHHIVDVDESVESSGDGYVSAGGTVLKTGLGGCLQSGTNLDDNVINKCEGIEEEVVEAVEEVEEVVVEAPQPPEQTAKIDTREFSVQPTFAINSAALNDDSQSLMSDLFSDLSEYKGITSISVTGHTDSLGSEEYNQTLSEQRAATVAAEIAAQYPNARIDVRGLGESSPVADNSTAEGRQQNRRVDVEISATRMTFN